jgi:acetyl-CoA carboxylase biotin carboxyl carrier protein
VRIVKAGLAAPAVAAVPVQAVPVAAPAAVAAPVAAAPAEPAVTGHVVKSPMVGTFYRSSSPAPSPSSRWASQVKEGDAICIIEAMKILNEIEADKSGTITQVLGENGQAVEYGQPLFVIE